MILVTGCAGFIGYHLVKQLLAINNTNHAGEKIIGIDNLNSYYDPKLKQTRLDLLKQDENFVFEQIDLIDKPALLKLFSQYQFTQVIHLAAQAGVRYSIDHPDVYVESNLVGFTNILECCRHHQTKHLIFASTSSAYGANTKQPYSESQNTSHPMSFYAATKLANELMAHSYASLYQLPCTGLRFFTVYGPWGRPDMALFKFTQKILAGEPIDVYNHGKMQRDFTFVDDIVEGIIAVANHPAKPNPQWNSYNGDQPDPGSSYAPYKIYNIGNSKPTSLMDYIAAIENAVGKKAICNMLPMQAGDVPSTYADTARLETAFGYKPNTSVATGVQKFVDWYLAYIN